MNYRENFEQCFDYIASHLTEDLSLSVLAAKTGYSPFHFCHIFRLYQELSPTEYIRKRRLYASLTDIEQGSKIIDIAMKYRFETASGYTKSFHKMFGFTPSEYRSYQLTLHAANDDSEYFNPSGPKLMPLSIHIQEIPSFMISGFSISVNLDNTKAKKQIAALWDHYETSELEEQLYHELNPQKHAEIGIMLSNDLSDSHGKYMLGVIAQNTDHALAWNNYQIPAGRYAIVTTPPADMTKDCNALADTVKRVWQYLFSVWFPESGYDFDESRNGFEYYDERCHYSNSSVMDIYLPVK